MISSVVKQYHSRANTAAITDIYACRIILTIITQVSQKDWQYHSAKITSVSWSPDSSRLATGSIDTNVIVWTVAAPDSVSPYTQPLQLKCADYVCVAARDHQRRPRQRRNSRWVSITHPPSVFVQISRHARLFPSCFAVGSVIQWWHPLGATVASRRGSSKRITPHAIDHDCTPHLSAILNFTGKIDFSADACRFFYELHA